MDCIFCKISNGEIPNYTVYEDEHVLAFLDVHPHARGHVVLIPKIHTERLHDLQEDDWKNISLGMSKTLRKIESVLNPDAINIAINDGSEAGQVVPHIHWHFLPRYQGDSGGSIHSIINDPSDERPEVLHKLF